MNTLGRSLRVLRVLHDENRYTVSRRLGLLAEDISDFELGKAIPTIYVLQGYAFMYDLPLKNIQFFDGNLKQNNWIEKSRVLLAHWFLLFWEWRKGL